MADRRFKITVCFESRADGGLRAWSPDLPGFVLSHRNIDGLLADVEPALKTILDYRFDTNIAVQKLENIREALEDDGLVAPRSPFGRREYVAYRA